MRQQFNGGAPASHVLKCWVEPEAGIEGEEEGEEGGKLGL